MGDRGGGRDGGSGGRDGGSGGRDGGPAGSDGNRADLKDLDSHRGGLGLSQLIGGPWEGFKQRSNST